MVHLIYHINDLSRIPFGGIRVWGNSQHEILQEKAFKKMYKEYFSEGFPKVTLNKDDSIKENIEEIFPKNLTLINNFNEILKYKNDKRVNYNKRLIGYFLEDLGVGYYMLEIERIDV